MRSGLESTSNRYDGAWVQSPNRVRYALNRNLLSPPGTEMDYSTGNTHLHHRHPHEGERLEHLAVRRPAARATARVPAGALASGSPGRLFRRERHVDDASSDGHLWRAVSASRDCRRPPSPVRGVDPPRRSCRAASPGGAARPMATAGGCGPLPGKRNSLPMPGALADSSSSSCRPSIWSSSAPRLRRPATIAAPTGAPLTRSSSG